MTAPEKTDKIITKNDNFDNLPKFLFINGCLISKKNIIKLRKISINIACNVKLMKVRR